LVVLALAVLAGPARAAVPGSLGREVAVPERLPEGAEYSLPLPAILAYGEKLFSANWTIQEGAGRPGSKGTGGALSDPSRPLTFPRNFNRVSAPDANSCAGCHHSPSPGGDGDIVANVFVTAQRFDFATFDLLDLVPTGGAIDERGERVTVQNIGNSRATLGMFGSGYIEMLARQMTRELQAVRDTIAPGDAQPLRATGVAFGELRRNPDGTWDTSGVTGLPAPSLRASATVAPSLQVLPFHQAGHVVSLRQFSNNAFNHHHGMQAAERFGAGVDADGDSLADEMTRGDLTAVTLFQATLAVPGRVIPSDPAMEQAVTLGEEKFAAIGCVRCHVPFLALPLGGGIFTEPNPYNPAGNLRPGDAPELAVDLADAQLPGPRLQPGADGVVRVPAFTDLKLHDITAGPGDPNREPIDMNEPAGSAGFFAGNGRFLTRKLWGAYGKPNFFHHGLYTTMREAILAHAGEALGEREAFAALTAHERDCVIEFLKTLRVLPAGTSALVVDEQGQPRAWPPVRLLSITRDESGIRLQTSPDSPVSAQPRHCQLQRCEDLATGVWTDIGEPTAETELVDPNPVSAGFYRLAIAGR
jgi:hypothetical protein